MMKTLIVAASMALLPPLALAQTSKAVPAKTSSKKVSSKAAAKTSNKASSKASITVASRTPVAKSSKRNASPAPSAAIAVQAAAAALNPASPEALAIAERVYVGEMPCELGTSVTVAADPKAPGHFEVTGKGFKYQMLPVATSTGAIRLEDRDGGAVWLQIGNKSMLMDQKRGQRMADECKNPAQFAVAEALLKAPARSLLDDPAK